MPRIPQQEKSTQASMRTDLSHLYEIRSFTAVQGIHLETAHDIDCKKCRDMGRERIPCISEAVVAVAVIYGPDPFTEDDDPECYERLIPVTPDMLSLAAEGLVRHDVRRGSIHTFKRGF